MPKNYSNYQYISNRSALKHVKVLIFKDKILLFRNFLLTCSRFLERYWRDARVVEEARLESVYTPKAYRGFESRSLRKSENNKT